MEKGIYSKEKKKDANLNLFIEIRNMNLLVSSINSLINSVFPKSWNIYAKKKIKEK